MLENLLDELEVTPVDERGVAAEHAQLPAGTPDRWLYGWHLRGTMSDFRGRDDTPVPGSLVPGSVQVFDRSTGRLLREAVDYLIDERWSSLTRIGDWSGEVVVSYRFRLTRVDSVVESESGKTDLLPGLPHLSNPVPPDARGARPIANVFVPREGAPLVLPITRSRIGAVSAVQTDRLPHASALLRGGSRPLRVTCWGDSVTAGGSASSWWSAYPQLISSGILAAGLRATVSTVAVGGTNTAQWLSGAAGLSLDRLEDTRPDVIVAEFVNDAELPLDVVIANYEALLARCAAWGCELILTTPHFVMLEWMGNQLITDADRRPYVGFLRDFAQLNSVALADAARHWEALPTIGIPYPTLLRNGINHPDDRGHRIYAQEILSVLGLPFPGDINGGSMSMPTSSSD